MKGLSKLIYRLKALRKRGRRRRRRPSIQYHHIRYPNHPLGEWKVPLWGGEHWIITQMNRRKRISKGFITSLKEWLKENEGKAVELEKNPSFKD